MSVLTPIPRRAPLEVHGTPAASAQLRLATAAPRAGALWTVARSLWWLGAGFLLWLRLTWDALRGRRSTRNFACRLRQTFEKAGGAVAKIGQSLALRVDLFPFEVCEELGRIQAVLKPLDISYVVARIEAAAKRPLAAVFERFDPAPIHTGMTSAVYQGVLRTGARVVVKVRRPDIAERAAADLRCIEWLTYLPELMTIVKPRFFQQLRDGLRQVVVDEIDFAREGRYQRLFRLWAKKARFDWLSAPRVYTPLSSIDVLVSAHVDGLLCSELLTLVERGDQLALDRLAAAGITPRGVARRLFQAQFWSYFEALFFHAEPHGSDIVIQPGGRLVFLDFGSAGTVSSTLRRNQQELIERALADDAAGMSDVALFLLAPLPHIDVYELKKAIEASFHRFLFALRDKRARWFEDAPMNMWIALLEATRQFYLPVPTDVLRLARAAVLYDSIAFRLARLKFVREYRRYRRQALHRHTRRIESRIVKATPYEVRQRMIVTVAHLQRVARKAAWTARVMVQARPAQLTATIRKAAYAALSLLTLIVRVVVIESVAVSGTLAWRAVTRSFPADWPAFIREHVIFHPVVIALVLLTAWIQLRRVLFRLAERDAEDSEQASP